MTQADELLAEALRLPVNERAALAQQILDSISGEGFDDPSVADAWAREIALRIQEFKAGAPTSSWEDLEAELISAEDQHER